MAIAGEATSFATQPARAFNPSALAGRAKLALLLLLVVLPPWLCLTQPAPPPPAEPDDEAASAAAPVEKTPPESNYIFRKAALAEPWEIEEPDPALSTQTLF